MGVVIYARVSPESQEARGTIGSQLEALTSELGHGVIHEIHRRWLLSSATRPPALEALLDAAEAGLWQPICA